MTINWQLTSFLQRQFSPEIIFDSENALSRPFRSPEERAEYIKLTARELLCGRLRLRRAIRGGGAVFSVGKANKHTQRKIWHGAAVSSSAAEPPTPHRLANPASFPELDVKLDEQLYFSKRDASTFFDVLKSPASFHPYFGQPGVTVGELRKYCGFSTECIRSMIEDDSAGGVHESLIVFPVHVVWPMGFSWSSAI